MHGIHDQHLSIITRIGKYFLIAGHAGIKANFTGRGADGAKSLTDTGCSVFQNQNCRLFLLHFLKTYAKKNIQSLSPTLNFSPVGVKKGKIKILPSFYS